MHKQYSSLMDYALRIISKKRYTVNEMRKKLGEFLRREDKDVESGENLGGEASLDGSENQEEMKLRLAREASNLVDQVIERLIELNYLNDLEYARHYVSDRSRFRPRGKMMIRRELMVRGIAKGEIESAFGGGDGEEIYDETACAESLLARKERSWAMLDLKKKREKAYRFLQSKGFERDAIYKAIRSCYNRISE